METWKLSKLEWTLLILTGLTLAFLSGWYFGTGNGTAAYTVTAERMETASPEASPAANPAPELLEGERININTASRSDLERLPGIGRKRAEDIVAYRETHGPFLAAEELAEIPGIGEITLRSLLDFITVGEE